MGREKILLRLGEETALERVLRTLRAAGVDDPIVVLRPDLQEAIALAERLGARVVVNPHPEDEMLLSIRMGIAALPPQAEAFFVWPADHPAVSAGTLAALARATSPDRVVVPTNGGRRGHPALVGAGLLDAIAAIPPGSGLRQLWRDRPEVLVEVAVADEGVVLDMNTPADYEKLSRRSW
jgi:molybdenum cofactor cytidylyltransferase